MTATGRAIDHRKSVDLYFQSRRLLRPSSPEGSQCDMLCYEHIATTKLQYLQKAKLSEIPKSFAFQGYREI